MLPSPNLIFSLVIFLDLKKGPTFFPIRLPRLEAFLSPIILKILNKEITIINSKKYFNSFHKIFFISSINWFLFCISTLILR